MQTDLLIDRNVEEGLHVHSCPWSAVSEMILTKHYLKRRPNAKYSFLLTNSGDRVGACVIGNPVVNEIKVGVCRDNPKLVLELNRLWVDDCMPRNTESWFVSRCLKMIPPRIVVSYADTAQGHLGIIYRACNFKYAGLSKDTYDWIMPGNDKHSRSHKWGEGIKVKRSPKHRYWITTGNKKERKKLAAMCGWENVAW